MTMPVMATKRRKRVRVRKCQTALDGGNRALAAFQFTPPLGRSMTKTWWRAALAEAVEKKRIARAGQGEGRRSEGNERGRVERWGWRRGCGDLGSDEQKSRTGRRWQSSGTRRFGAVWNCDRRRARTGAWRDREDALGRGYWKRAPPGQRSIVGVGYRVHTGVSRSLEERRRAARCRTAGREGGRSRAAR